MSDMECPFCHQTIVCIDAKAADEYATWFCPRCVAERKWYAFGSKTLWQELIRTRKALEEYANKDNWGCIEDDRDRFIHTYWYFDGCDDGGWVSAEKALEQITTQE